MFCSYCFEQQVPDCGPTELTFPMTAGHKYEICNAEYNSETHSLVVENQDCPGKSYHFD